MQFLSLILAVVACFILATEASLHSSNADRHMSRAERTVLSKRSTYHGKATWFVPSKEGGSDGACGKHEDDDALIVALNHPQYGDMSSKSKWCGKKIKISANGKHVTATVNDACPECKHGDLDLTPVLFEKLADLDKGIIKISWTEI
ncbi:RlpA-like double-psi beta-barrel-protein domain-containing protein-containing protein [Radiomyces spectabilis]|uniref:RlpA-like double-psi beta-barrel-protein domain-containing protein-containing protein n=1 Tax=Radiomyces spectabilis TaxID=64574 RepID=UPI0022208B58|nr:RlpA-like double-psi beta-barrel-protein domain-containing protein-containing protein [Radiomyces spectabilis]KAI8378055.1 RlpA-like double-psi beta-barrel-protein domain-containing protein-containing protein [Radiomyces spectabilis]